MCLHGSALRASATFGDPGGKVSDAVTDKAACLDVRERIPSSASPVSQGRRNDSQNGGGLPLVDLSGCVLLGVAQGGNDLFDDFAVECFGFGLHGKAPIGCG